MLAGGIAMAVALLCTTCGGAALHYVMEPADDGAATLLTHTWEVLPALHGMYAEKYGDQAQAVLDHRTESARTGIPRTLAVVKEVVEGG